MDLASAWIFPSLFLVISEWNPAFLYSCNLTVVFPTESLLSTMWNNFVLSWVINLWRNTHILFCMYLQNVRNFLRGFQLFENFNTSGYKSQNSILYSPQWFNKPKIFYFLFTSYHLPLYVQGRSIGSSFLKLSRWTQVLRPLCLYNQWKGLKLPGPVVHRHVRICISPFPAPMSS